MNSSFGGVFPLSLSSVPSLASKTCPQLSPGNFLPISPVHISLSPCRQSLLYSELGRYKSCCELLLAVNSCTPYLLLD